MFSRPIVLRSSELPAFLTQRRTITVSLLVLLLLLAAAATSVAPRYLKGSLTGPDAIIASMKQLADTDHDFVLTVREIRTALVTVIREVVLTNPAFDINGDDAVNKTDISSAVSAFRSLLAAVCGNGRTEAGEQCDDNNRAPGDGCTDTCAVETGFTCTGQPSSCRTADPACGNGSREGDEQCDASPSMGCSPTCRLGLGDLIIDDGDPGFVTTGPWNRNTQTGYNADRMIVPALSSSICVGIVNCIMRQNASVMWKFENLPAATYEVFVRWRDTETLRPSGAYEIWDDDLRIATITFPATNLEKDATGNWGKLGTFNVPSHILKVMTTNNVGWSNSQYPAEIIADAVMLRRTVCGDAVKEGGEACDDGNQIAGDGCTALCVAEFCGDKAVQPAAGEQCDDGNTKNGDGCDSLCKNEPIVCGDFVIQSVNQEQCDDGNTVSGDGCSAACLAEAHTTCGDGIRNHPAEECDDGNRTTLDGCDFWCRTENSCYGTVPNINEEITKLTARDTDGDGVPNSVVATNGPGNMIYSFSPGENGKIGTFAALRSDLAPMYYILLPEAEFGDLDGDGIRDMVTTGYAYPGKSDQTFETTGRPLVVDDRPWDYPPVAVTDLDDDGDNDIVFRHYEGSNYSSYFALINEGAWQFHREQITGHGRGDMAVGFVDHDRLPDFVVGTETTGEISVILNRMTNPTDPFLMRPGIVAPYSGVDLGDFNHDGHADILLSKREQPNMRIYYGNGGGAFTLLPYTAITMYVGDKEPAVLDIDHDGDSDIIVRGNDGKSVQTLVKTQGSMSMNSGVPLCSY